MRDALILVGFAILVAIVISLLVVTLLFVLLNRIPAKEWVPTSLKQEKLVKVKVWKLDDYESEPEEQELTESQIKELVKQGYLVEVL
jgi:hypothetical protein